MEPQVNGDHETSKNQISNVTKSMKQVKFIEKPEKQEEDQEEFENQDSEELLIDPNSEIPKEFQTKHPLQNSWTLWYDNPGRKTTQEKWAENLKKIVTFDTVEDFWRIFNNIRPASKLTAGSDYHLFKEGVEPKWEHEENKKGGKWVVTGNPKKKELLDNLWLWTILACIGENFEEEGEICGCVVSVRKSQDRVSLWTKTASKEQVTKSIGATWKKTLELPSTMTIGYQAHEDSMKGNSSFGSKNRYEI